jgi:Protein of unknown function (DUF4199)
MKTEIKFGLILGLGICAYTTLAHLLGFYTNNIQAGKYGDVVIILLPLAVLFLAIREKRMHSGSLAVLEGVKTGLSVALVSFSISTTFLWLYHHYINPGWLGFIVAYEREAMTRAGMDAAEIATRIDQMRAGNSDFAQLVGGFIGTMVLSLILSLIFSLILRRKPTRAA